MTKKGAEEACESVEISDNIPNPSLPDPGPARKQCVIPYGCTFLCNETFASKNEWKRHENSQHFQLETWRCDNETSEEGVCAKVYYRRQSFQNHLKTEHHMEDDAMKEKTENCRIGRNCQARFWCGFCSKIIGLERKGLDAWTERFDHIDDHFMGNHGLKKQCILDWIPVDGRELKGESLRDEDHLDPVSPSGSIMKGDDELLKSFNVVIQTSALDTVTTQLTPKDSLLHTSMYEVENKTQKGWFLNRVTSGDLEMNQLEIRAIRNFHAGSLPRRGTLICCCYVVLAIIMALILLWK
ncbi:hypothetical protein B0O99DRAFT_694301 [Bisporella sp. PMI_857]|nr:hypothetical protein B0O99DRAFT_694301 [Bisporella sp. PMI_857]